VENSEGEAIEVPLQPMISAETAALLESLLGFYDQLAEQGGDLLYVRQQAAKANVRVAAIRRQLGQFGETAAAYQRALAVYRQLDAESGSEQNYQVETAEVHNELGNLYVTVHRPGSGTFFGRYAAPCEQALAENMYLAPWNHGKS
jgi:hypothetical protein